MKKTILIPIALTMAAVCIFAGACAGGNANYVSNDAQDLLQEDFGIALKKGDTEMVAAVNAVVDAWVDDGTMDKYFEYYSDLADENSNPTAPTGLKLTWDLDEYTDTLDMYTESGFAPYEFLNSNGYTVSDGNAEEGAYAVAGLDVAIACQVAENLHCKLVIHDVAFDDIITNLKQNSGKAIAAAGLTINEERLQEVDFSNIYSSSTLSIVCAEDANYHNLKDLDGLKIGVQKGTSGDLIASAAKTSAGYTYEVEDAPSVTIKLSSSDTEIVTYETYAAALAALQMGKIDVIFMDKVPSLLLLANI